MNCYFYIFYFIYLQQTNYVKNIKNKEYLHIFPEAALKLCEWKSKLLFIF